MNNAHERLISEDFVSAPQHRRLEMTGRMVLLAASNQSREYGAGNIRLLKSFTDDGDIRTEYSRRCGFIENVPNNLVVRLNSEFIRIALSQDYIDDEGHVATRIDSAHLTPDFGVLYTYLDDGALRQPLENDALAKFEDSLYSTIERNEIILDRNIL